MTSIRPTSVLTEPTALPPRRTRTIAWLQNFDWDRLSLAAAVVLGLVFGIGQAGGQVSAPIDFSNYWRASLDHLYVASWDDPGLTYIYPPPMAQLLAPLHVVPFAVATVAWTTLAFLCLWYCVREWTLPVAAAGAVAILLPDTSMLTQALSGPLSAVLLGNVNIVIAAIVVAAIRRPEWWAVSAVLKVGTGVGVLWHPARGDWRGLVRAGAILLGIVIASFALAPSLWSDWVSFVLHNPNGSSLVPVVGPPLWMRGLAAVALTVYAARTSRAWLVPVACAIANPAIYSIGTVLAVGCGAVSLWTRPPASHADRPASQRRGPQEAIADQ